METVNIYKPVLFSTVMVQANLENRKKQTRRICEINPMATIIGLYTKRRIWNSEIESNPNPLGHFAKFNLNGSEIEIKSKFTEGDILWVRETFCEPILFDGCESPFYYKADNVNASNTKVISGKWKPSLFMPKKASRIFLKVTNVRCERLQDISETDAIEEGIEQIPDWHNEGKINYFWKDYERNIDESEVDESVAFFNPIHSFQSLWDSINAKKYPWKSNPWVWVYDFERIEKPAGFNY